MTARASSAQPWILLVALATVCLTVLAATAPAAALADPGVDVGNTTENTTSTVEDTTESVTGDTTGTVSDTADDTTDGTDGSSTGTTDDPTTTTAETLDSADGTSDAVTGTLDDGLDLDRLGTLEGTVDGVADTTEGTLVEATGDVTDDLTAAGLGPGAEPSRSTVRDGSSVGGTESGTVARPDRPAPDAEPLDAGGRLPPLAAGSLAGVAIGGVVAQRAIGLASGPGRTGLRGSYRQARAATRGRLVRWRRWARRLAGLAGYQRYDDSDPLEHEGRAGLHAAIEAAGSAYPAELSRETGMPLSTVRYHLRVLEGEGLVESAEIRGKRRYSTEGPTALDAALEDEATAALLRALAAEGPSSVSGLADAVDRDVSTVTHHLQLLADDGLVERERDGRAVVNRLAPRACEALEGPEPVEARADD